MIRREVADARRFSLTDLVAYTDQERQKWHDSLRQHGDEVLKISAGPHGDDRFSTVGDVIRHIFSAEKRYVERLGGRSLTDTGSVPTDNIDALFQFGQQSRKELNEFLVTFHERGCDKQEEFRMFGHVLTATPRKIIVHVLMHEIRHWGQIATLLRLNGVKVEFHDFLFSPVLGGDFRPEQDHVAQR